MAQHMIFLSLSALHVQLKIMLIILLRYFIPYRQFPHSVNCSALIVDVSISLGSLSIFTFM